MKLLCIILLFISCSHYILAQKPKAKTKATTTSTALDSSGIGLKIAESLGIASSIDGAEKALLDSIRARISDVPKGYWETAVKALNIRRMFGAQMYSLFMSLYTPKEIEQLLGYLAVKKFPETDELAKRFINGQKAMNEAINERFARVSETATLNLYRDYHDMRAKASPVLTSKPNAAYVKALTPFLEKQGDLHYADTLKSDVEKMIAQNLKDAPSDLLATSTRDANVRQLLINTFTAAYAKNFSKAEIEGLGKIGLTDDSKGAEDIIAKFNDTMAKQLGVDISTALNQVGSYLNDLVLKNYYSYKITQQPK